MTATPQQKKTARRVDVTLRTTTQQRWGDSYNEAAAQPATDTSVLLRHSFPHGDPRDARHALGRLLFAARLNDTGDVSGNIDSADVEVGRASEAVAEFHVFMRPTDVVLGCVLRYAEELRRGVHDPPAITVQQSRDFAELGIALRNDGIFGYKRRCAHEACNNVQPDECFGSLDPAEAIRGARKRADLTCSTDCWLDAGWGTDDTAEVLRNWILKSGEEDYLASTMADLRAGGLVRIEEKPIPREVLVDDWWTKAKANSGARSRVLQAALEAIEYGDYDGAEDAIDCEV